MTGCQIVDADHNDRVQDEDLTQKNDLRLWAFGTDKMTTSACNVALRVSNVWCYYFVFFFFFVVLYDRGYSCRLVRHGSNDASIGGRLLFIPKERLGIDSTVELGGAPEPPKPPFACPPSVAAAPVSGYRNAVVYQFALIVPRVVFS